MFLKNLEVLKKSNPKLATDLMSFPLEKAQGVVSAYNAGSNDTVIALNNTLLDDSSNPIQKAKEVWESSTGASLSKTDIAIVYGLGLGYLFKRAYISTQARIILIEPSIEVLRFVLEYVDFTKEIADKRVYFANNPEDAIEYFSHKYINNDKIEVICSPFYINTFSEKIISFTDKLAEACKSKKADVNTIQNLSKDWTLNNISNYKYMKNSRPLSFFKDCFSQKTALIVGAGPSLRDNLDKIKKYRDKFVIFSVNKVYDLLEENGIQVNFITAADSKNIANTIKVYPNKFKDVNLIISTKADGFILEQQFNSVINYYLKNDAFYDDAEEKFPQIMKRYETEGAAISQCYHSAVEMGFKNLIFVGFDFAIKKDRAYAMNLETCVDENNNLHIPLYFDIKELVKVKSAEGLDIFTREDYYHFAKRMEEQFKKTKDVNLYNTTDFGMYIEEMKYKQLEEIANTLESNNDKINDTIKVIFEKTNVQWDTTCKYHKHFLENQLSDMQNLYNELNKWVSNNSFRVRKLEGTISNKILINKYADINKKQTNFMKKIMNNIILATYYQYDIFVISKLYESEEQFTNATVAALNLFEQILDDKNMFIDKFSEILV